MARLDGGYAEKAGLSRTFLPVPLERAAERC